MTLEHQAPLTPDVPASRLPTLLLAITALGFALRLAALLWAPEHVDEGFTRELAALGPWEAAQAAMARDTHPPLHYVLVALLYEVFGQGRWVSRLPSLVAGVATVPLTFAVAREVAPRGVSLLAAGLLSVNAWHVVWSGWARAYPLVVAATCVAWLGALRGIRGSGRPVLDWGLVVVGSLAAMYLHNFGLLATLVPIGILVAATAWHEPRPQHFVRPALVAAGVTLLFWVPYVPHLLHQFDRATSSLAWNDLTPRKIVGSLRRPWSARGLPAGFGWLDALVFAAGTAAVPSLRRRSFAGLVALPLWWWWLPAVSLALYPVRRVFIDRVFLSSVVPMSIVLAVGLVVLAYRHPRVARVGGAAYVIANLAGSLQGGRT